MDAWRAVFGWLLPLLAIAASVVASTPVTAEAPTGRAATSPSDTGPVSASPQSSEAPPPGTPGTSNSSGPSATAAPSAPAAPASPPASDAAVEALQALAPRPILPPADPTAAAAFGVLDTHCARCHQGGRLKRSAPAAGFGNILRLGEIAGAPHLVQPGNPDGSRLYLMLLRRLMPYDAHILRSGEAAPTAAEISAVRSWIAGLTPRPQCRDRRLVSQADLEAAVARTATEAGAAASRIRFLSIAHLHNGCAGFEALAAYRQAVVKLVNSLSWKPTLVAVTAVDEARTLFRVDLGDLGWLPEHWERIMRSGPEPLGLTRPLPEEARRPFGTQIPVARADWFAATVLKAPLYYDVLGLPGTGPEILKILQVDPDRLAQTGGIQRLAARPSGVSIQPSLLERLATRTGGLWTSYHAIARDAAVDPSGHAGKPLAEPVPHHASRTMFRLPNGLPAFYVVGQRGDRLDELPPDIARPGTTGRGGFHAGLDCFSCHGGGPARRDGEPGADAPPALAALAGDAKAVAEAHQKLGLAPGLTLDGVEPIVALALEYARPLSAERAAAELGVEMSDMLALADRSDGTAPVLARRLAQGIVPRGEIEERGDELMAALGRTGAPSAGGSDRPRPAAAAAGSFQTIDPGPGLLLYSDKARYRQGDALHLVIRVASDCHLTVVSVDQRGRGTVIFPSDFETNTLLTAGQELRLPGSGAPYAFRLRERGREQIVALCNAVSATTDGIAHDFERQRFTDLGNYAAWVSSHASSEQAGQERSQRRNETRQRGGRRRGPVETVDPPVRPDQITRAAITIVVE